MQVETYEQEEVEQQDGIDDVQVLEAIEAMDLKGQRKFIKSNGTAIERMPYRLMDTEEFFIYSAMCPKKTVVADYDFDPIPLRVLRVLAHAKDCFKRLEVWHPAVPSEKDPVLVGIDERDKRFILARWGSVLCSLAELREEAMKRWREKYVSNKREEVRHAEQAIRDTEGMDFHAAVEDFSRNWWRY